MPPASSPFGPVTIARLIRLASLTLAVWASRKGQPANAVETARTFETYVRGGDQ